MWFRRTSGESPMVGPFIVKNDVKNGYDLFGLKTIDAHMNHMCVKSLENCLLNLKIRILFRNYLWWTNSYMILGQNA